MVIQQQCEQLQSIFIRAIDRLTEVQIRANKLFDSNYYEAQKEIIEILEICDEALRNLQAGSTQIQLIQGMIGEQTLLGTTIKTYPIKETKSPEETKKMSNPDWPPQAPEGTKPNFNEPGAAEWRYERYKYDQYQAGKQQEDILSFETWKERYFNPAAQGGRPGRPGTSEQVAARQALANEGFQNVENVELGGRYPDMVRYNTDGSIDYVEVGEMLQNGMPEARERVKISEEIVALRQNDTVTFVDKMDIARRITYRLGDDVETKTLNN